MNKKRVSLIIFIIGLLVLVGGLTFLLVKTFANPGISNAEYLVQVGTWQEKDADGVIWTFTEVGKGTLTTNNHTNDYDFIWAIENDKLKIETSWLSTLNDEFTYNLNQGANTLELKSGDKTTVFVPQSKN